MLKCFQQEKKFTFNFDEVRQRRRDTQRKAHDLQIFAFTDNRHGKKVKGKLETKFFLDSTFLLNYN